MLSLASRLTYRGVSSPCRNTVKRSFAMDGKLNESLTSKYTIVDHTYDVVVVGAGGAGLRCSLRTLPFMSPLSILLSLPHASCFVA